MSKVFTWRCQPGGNEASWKSGLIGFNLDFVADPDAEDSAEEEEVEEVELEGSEIPLGSTTFAACFEARTLQHKFASRYFL